MSTDAIYSDMAIEQGIREHFGLKLEIGKVILRDAPVSRMANAVVFLTDKKQLYVYINGQSRLQLGDVRKIIARMGLVPELFIPPKGKPTYFDDIAKDKFKEVFPGRSNPGNDDLAYYRTLAPYNPALIQLLEVKGGEIKVFDTDASSGWRVGTKFAYRRIRTS